MFIIGSYCLYHSKLQLYFFHRIYLQPLTCPILTIPILSSICRPIDYKKVYRKPPFPFTSFPSHLTHRPHSSLSTALLLAYGSSTTISVLPCLIYLLTPSTSFPPLTTTPTSTVKDLTSTELLMLLSFYVPFLLIPFGMSVDMGMRILEVIGKEERRGKMSKSR